MKTQQMREAKERLTEEFVKLLSMNPEDGVCWKGTMLDLIEITHIAYSQGVVCDAEGNPCTFCQMVRRICAVLHVNAPCNPRSYAQKALQRKGVRCSTFLERYTHQISATNDTNDTNILSADYADSRRLFF